MLPLTLALIGSLCAAQDARWTFDDGAKDALPTLAKGRLEFIDSPIGGSGRAAVFNAVDSTLEVSPTLTVGTGSAEFTLSFWMLVLDKRPVTLFSRKGWALSLQEDGSLRFAIPPGFVSTNPGACPPGQWCHVVVTRGETGKVYINGDLAGLGDLKAGTLDAPQGPLLIGKGADEIRPFGGLMDDIRLSAGTMDLPAVQKLTDEGLPWLRAKAHAKRPFGARFELKENDVVAFTGAEDARVGQEAGYLETLLSLFADDKKVHFRNMTWEGDTVYERYRPLNFGSWTDQFRRAGVSVVFAQFGQIESLEGKAGVERFAAAYEALLAQFAATTKRIVLVTPAPFGKAGPNVPNLAARNEDLKLYVEAIRKLAAKNNYLLVDLSTPAMAADGLSRDGLHLSTAGQWAAARETARQLEVPGVSDLDAPDERGVFRREKLEKIRSLVRVKNGLWTDSWRPANWAFLGGDRMDQPSSRDHVDRRIRWFPVEIQQFQVLVRREEIKIETLIQTAEKK